jgi:endonuclease/exonuclease/phosphatase family metal-dependent hydrolase
MHEVKLVCWNIDNCLSIRKRNRHKRGQKIVRILLDTKPNVICLQEVMHAENAIWLCDQLSLYSKRPWSVVLPHPGGMCILADRNFTDSYTVDSPVRGNYCNGLVGAKVYGVWWFSIHLDSRRYLESETLRVRETKWILDTVSSLKGPKVLAGDWNSVSHLDKEFTNNLVRCKKGTSACQETALSSFVLEKRGWSDLHVETQTHDVPTWIPTKSHERIDRIYSNRPWGDSTMAGTLGGSAEWSAAEWPTGRDHKLVWATVYV